jgi:hypothetical protein
MGGLLAWTFHSPRRLLVVVVTPIVVVAAIAAVMSSNQAGKEEAARALPESVQSETPSRTPGPTRYTTTPSPDAPSPGAIRAARVFVETWLAGRTTKPVANWHKQLAKYATPQLAEGLRSTDPSRLPETTVSGAPEPVRVGEYLANFLVPLADGSNVAVSTTWDGQAWRVTDIQPGGNA